MQKANKTENLILYCMMKLNVALNANVCKSVKVSFYFTIVYKTSAGI